MGATCFCGCGRTIPLRHLAQRSHNNAGHEVVKQLTWMREGLAEKGETPDAETKRWLDEGDEIVGVLARAAHGELRRPNLPAVAEWRAEGREAERRAKAGTLLNQAALGRAMRESGKSQEEIIQALAHGDRSPKEIMDAIGRGEDDPFGA